MLILSKKNTFLETFRITFDQMSGNHGPIKLTHKINHCKQGHQLGYELSLKWSQVWL